jgi:lipopolysaccharide export system protein LptA
MAERRRAQNALKIVVRHRAVVIAALLCLNFMAPHYAALAQNEPEPDTNSLEEPTAEPTEFTPVTAGDAERGSAPAATATDTPTAAATITEQPTPAATPTPSRHAAHHPQHGKQTAAAASSSPAAASAPAASQRQKSTARGAAGADIVPSDSPFAGLNFSNQKGPTNITSDSGDLDYKNKVALFAGHVHAIQGGGDLTSDKLKVQYGNDFNDIRMIYADGNVRMSQGTQWITSDHAVLDQSTHIVTFFGNPVAHDQKDQITGSTIKVDLVSGKSTVDKPRVIIFPREGKNPDNVDASGSP